MGIPGMALWTSLRDSFIILSLSAAREKVSVLQPAISPPVPPQPGELRPLAELRRAAQSICTIAARVAPEMTAQSTRKVCFRIERG